MMGAGHKPAPLNLEAAPPWGGFFVCTGWIARAALPGQIKLQEE
jgi:hypothetical protein